MTSTDSKAPRWAVLIALSLLGYGCGPSGGDAADPGRDDAGTDPSPAPTGPTGGADPPAAPAGIDTLPPPDPIPTLGPEDLASEREILAKQHPDRAGEVQTLRELLSLSPGDATRRGRLGELLHELDLPRHAERELLATVEIDGTHARAHLLLADLYWMSADHGRAMWHLERSLRHDPTDAEGYMLAGMVLRDGGAFDAAVHHVDAGLELHPYDPKLLVLRGGLHLDAGEVDEAIARLEAGLKLDPDHLSGHLWLGNAFVLAGNEARAIEEQTIHRRLQLLHSTDMLAGAKEMDEGRRAALLASIYRAGGRPDLAREELSRAFMLAPGDPDARVVEAQILLDEGDPVGAVELLDALIADEPSHRRALRVLSRICSVDGGPVVRDPARALELADRALQAGASRDRESWMARALALHELGRGPEAVQSLRRVLHYEPDHPEALELMAALAEDAPGR